VFACANGTTPVGFDGTAVDPNEAYLPPSSSGDSSTKAPPPPSEKSPDAATPDSGKPIPVDAGDSGAPPTGSGDCVGTMSAQLSASYDEACDAFFWNTFGDSNPCNPGGTSCAALDTPSLKFCCYNPPAGSDCDFDYGAPQCIPR
jgi:hypothetical protein